MATETIRIKLKAYDHSLLDDACKRIINTANKNGARIIGPIPLPTDREVITVIRSPFKHKDSREQFESRTHKRMIEILSPNAKAVDALMKIDLPAGVDIKIKI
ncbi:MAG: 30S ribosomal protein S10 [Clostridia bacterium]|jgi:small subunit ribosomal protein S10|nr:30S ribosomal protein S10 [Clostridia bacterium]